MGKNTPELQAFIIDNLVVEEELLHKKAIWIKNCNYPGHLTFYYRS